MLGSLIFLSGFVVRDLLIKSSANGTPMVLGTLRVAGAINKWEYISFISFEDIEHFKMIKSGDLITVRGKYSSYLKNNDDPESRQTQIVVDTIIYSDKQFINHVSNEFNGFKIAKLAVENDNYLAKQTEPSTEASSTLTPASSQIELDWDE